MNQFEGLLNEKVVSVLPVSGGCIGSNTKVTTKNNTYFVKHYSKPGIALKESNGLKELSKSHGTKIPEVINVTDNYLVLEFIEEGCPSHGYQERLAEALVSINKVKSDKYGLYEDNFIGNTLQKNSYSDDWVDFYITNRLDYQVILAGRSGYKEVEELYKKLRADIPDILKGSEEEPVLIHGDLWGGNVICDVAGNPVFIDPAVYYGHRELELAMTKLFGGFTPKFYDTYNNLYPLKKGWQNREYLYKLYHILNHLNIFGASYKNQALNLMKYYL